MVRSLGGIGGGAVRTALGVVLALGLLFASATVAVADTGSSDPDLVAAPPGSNDWSCRPGRDHPRPVVLLHGTFENRLLNWFALAPQLAGAGYCVYALDYGRSLGGSVSGVGPMAESARQIADFVDQVLASTGARQVDIVGHSQGGMLPRYYLKYLGGAGKVHTLVGLAPDNHGTTWGLLHLPITLIPPATTVACPACTEQLPTSEFMRRLDSDPQVLPDVHYTVIATDTDEFATPHSTSLLPPGPNVDNIVLQNVCPGDLSEHMLITSDPVAIRLVRNALDPAHAVTPTCAPLQVGSA
ncbi:esterase/lipase family protein [Nocardia terpenica]|uniref:Lipase n=1 Tax=Nocardia terpenica TaxID=455432 RepID=A0A0U1Z2L0_9NOCA|nr:alpha/beta fold hydrolase [Nocardia terpenica]AJO72791.1 Lipase [Nocardia terpenica]NQE85874.1 alpha/beta fold hydrolase [Nocardia terpenica]BBE00895.1 putative lipase [Nocardia terpenica]